MNDCSNHAPITTKCLGLDRQYMPKRRTRLTETREDVFEDVKTGNLDDPGLSFQEFSQRVDDKRDRLPVDDEGASIAVLNETDSGSPSQSRKTFETTTDDLYSARKAHESRTERAQQIDESRGATTTTDFDKWADDMAHFDFPGVDSTDDIGPTF